IHAMPRTADRPYAYPSLVEDADGEVVVELYDLDALTLAAADALEAFAPADETSSEYVRRAVDVRGGPVERGWVYRYHGDPSELGERISDGDWVAHRVRTE